MVLSGRYLSELVEQGLITTSSGRPVLLTPTSVDLHLRGAFLQYRLKADASGPIGVPTQLPGTVRKETSFVLAPGASVLAATMERIKMPVDLIGFIQPKGSISSGFLNVAADLVQPGYEGCLTLKLGNYSEMYLALREGMGIAQLVFAELKEEVPAYDGRFQGEESPCGMK